MPRPSKERPSLAMFWTTIVSSLPLQLGRLTQPPSFPVVPGNDGQERSENESEAVTGFPRWGHDSLSCEA